MFIPLVYAVMHMTPEVPAFAASSLIVLVIAEIMIRYGKEHPRRMGLLDAAAVMVFSWCVISLVGTLPYLLSGRLGPLDALFESVSNLTSTGITFLAHGEAYALRLWGSVISWLGGLGFVILLVTALPQVAGDFGLALSVPQGMMFSPMLSQMKRIAKQATQVYLAFTGITIALYWLAGLGFFDSLLAAMLTLSTNGGATNTGFMQRDSLLLELVAMVAMLLASVNFLMAFRAARRREFKPFLRDRELQMFLLMVALFTLVVAWHLHWMGVYDWADSFRYGTFAVVSFASTSGFMSAPIETWPDFDRFVLLVLVFVGGCIGSSTGGFKVKRFLILIKTAVAEVHRTLHPHMVLNITVGKQSIPHRNAGWVLCFFFLYLGVFYVFTLILSIADISTPECAGIAIGMLSSVGTASGLYGHEIFALLPAWVKLACCFFMVLGRLEIFGLLIFLSGLASRREKKW